MKYELDGLVYEDGMVSFNSLDDLPPIDDWLRDGEAMETTIVGRDTLFRKFPVSELKGTLANRNFISAMGPLYLPGVAHFQRMIELKYFMSWTAMEPALKVYTLKVVDTLWSMTRFPKRWSDLGNRPHDFEMVVAEVTAASRLKAVTDSHFAIGGTDIGHDGKIPRGMMPSGDAWAFSHGFMELDLPMENVLLLLPNEEGAALLRSDPKEAGRRSAEDMKNLETTYLPPELLERARTNRKS